MRSVDRKNLKKVKKKSRANAFYWFGFNGKETNNYQGYTAKVVENLGTILTPNASGITASKIDDALSILKTTFTGLNLFSKGSTDAQGGLDALDAQSSDNQAALNKANSQNVERNVKNDTIYLFYFKDSSFKSSSFKNNPNTNKSDTVRNYEK
jgi:hypothetical protein